MVERIMIADRFGGRDGNFSKITAFVDLEARWEPFSLVIAYPR
jgi:hypothetical protein